MTNRELVDAALAKARAASITLHTFDRKTYTPAARAKTAWGQFYDLLAQVKDAETPTAWAWPPAGQVRLYVPIFDRYRREQTCRSQTPSFYMVVDWVEHPFRFEVDGQPIGTFQSHDGGSDGSTVEGRVPAPLTYGLHVLQGFEDTHGTASVPVQFRVDPTSPNLG